MQHTLTQILSEIEPHLTTNDDILLVSTFLMSWLHEYNSLHLKQGESFEVFLQIGACSHWLRPHQTRITAAGGFAYPAGYLGSSDSRTGLPEFDWYVLFRRKQREWILTEKFFGKRKLVLRVAFPARTTRHNQSVVHTIWTPGTPTNPKVKTETFYCFKKNANVWKLAATTTTT